MKLPNLTGNILFVNKGGKKMIQVETNSQYRRAWEKRLQLEKRIKKLHRKSDIEYLRILKHKIRKYSNKEVTQTDIYWFIWGNNHKG